MTPEHDCGHATVGTQRPYAIHHLEGCSMPPVTSASTRAPMTLEHTMTGAARLREALEDLSFAKDRIENDWSCHGFHEDGCPRCEAHRRLSRAARGIREALAAVPEAPEPVYVYRAASDVIKWIHRETADEARADLPEVADEPTVRWVERRGPWERVEEGTER